MVVRVLYSAPKGLGYHPVTYMAQLAAELFEAKLQVIGDDLQTPMGFLGRVLPRRSSGDSMLLIAASPGRLSRLMKVAGLLGRRPRIVAWVFDSFWLEDAPNWLRFVRADHVFVTEREEVRAWRRKIRAEVSWAPWGSDVLRLGSPSGERDLDLVRVGRQPLGWSDDARTACACEARGLRFSGRPETRDDAGDNERHVMREFARTKFTLSFSNAVNPAAQTHPYRQYVTARWTDALAAGAVVAGIPPRSVSVDNLLWPEALLDIGTTDMAAGLDVIAQASKTWRAEQAAFNHLQALQRLDWRWRFAQIADAMGVQSAKLQREHDELRARIRQLAPVIASAPAV